jgi:hypothetical protein
MKALYTKNLFATVRRALLASQIDFQKPDENSILIWHDTILDTLPYFKDLKPFQVVNRLPHINLICRKAGLVQTIHRLFRTAAERESRPPELFPFLPRSFVLPKDQEFFKECRVEGKKYIVKSDQGSLGLGVSILKPGELLPQSRSLAIVQDYIESKLIENRKFDLRVYVLILGVDPPTIYVYRDGIARFCSEANGGDSLFSQITNTAVNRQNTSVTITDITRKISTVFPLLAEGNVTVESIWAGIDDAIIQTVLSVSDFLRKGAADEGLNGPYSRCFQILGFDVFPLCNLALI